MKTKKQKLIKKATVTMGRDEAAALLSSVEVALNANGGRPPAAVEDALYRVVETLNKAFDFGL